MLSYKQLQLLCMGMGILGVWSNLAHLKTIIAHDLERKKHQEVVTYLMSVLNENNIQPNWFDVIALREMGLILEIDTEGLDTC
jgi:hypothetical protein